MTTTFEDANLEVAEAAASDTNIRTDVVLLIAQAMQLRQRAVLLRMLIRYIEAAKLDAAAEVLENCAERTMEALDNSSALGLLRQTLSDLRRSRAEHATLTVVPG